MLWTVIQLYICIHLVHVPTYNKYIYISHTVRLILLVTTMSSRGRKQHAAAAAISPPLIKKNFKVVIISFDYLAFVHSSLLMSDSPLTIFLTLAMWPQGKHPHHWRLQSGKRRRASEEEKRNTQRQEETAVQRCGVG